MNSPYLYFVKIAVQRLVPIETIAVLRQTRKLFEPIVTTQLAFSLKRIEEKIAF